ncbi:MAG: LytTR family DNA-binding domain-containing protein [Bacteroidota bacterium]
MKCIIIEDQPPAQRILKKYIEDFSNLELVEVFANALDAFAFLTQNRVDLIFLDVHLPKMSGIDFLKSYRNPPAIIMTTAFPDYALEGYELDVVDYLLKPFSFQRFVQAVSKVPQQHLVHETADSPQKEYKKEIFIKSGHEYIKLKVDEIFYIKSDADYTEIFIPSKKHLSADPLRIWIEKLDPAVFARVHKSFIINTAKIERVVGNQIYLNEGHVIPLGRTYKEDFVNTFIK